MSTISVQELRHVTTSYTPNFASSAAGSSGTRAAGGPIAVFSPPPPVDGSSGAGPGGDGPVLVSLKQSLAAAGFSASNTNPGSGDDAQAAMHGFTHAFFDSVQAQRQADAAAGSPTTMRGAIRQLSDLAAAGNAPPDLQSAFDTLQQTQVAGSAASTATLSQVLSGMAATAPDDVATIGSLVDASA